MSAVLPDLSFEPTRGFWQAAARRELAVPCCRGCSRYVWYPRESCPDCGGRDISYRAVSGRGTLFSWALVERALWKPFADRVPYVTGLVALAEDPRVRIVTNVVDCEPSELRMDMAVEVVFRELSSGDARVLAPHFRPIRPIRPIPSASGAGAAGR